MKRTVGLLAAALVTMLALACSTKTTVLPPGTEAGITVSGEGSVFGTPDIALVNLGVQADAVGVGEARSKAATAMGAMLKALKDRGVADKDVQTTQFSVDPRYDYSGNKQTLIGFTVNNIVTVKIHAIDKTGELLDAAIAAGGDQARVNSLQFTIDDPSALQDQARQKAMADAKRRADTLAKAGGVTLGAPKSISETGGPTPIQFSAQGLGAVPGAPQAASPVLTGQLQVQVQVSVVYGLK